MKKEKLTCILMYICYGVLIFFMLTIAARIFTRVILVERLQINNALVRALFFDQPQLTDTKNGGMFQMNEEGENMAALFTDWEALYPFDEADLLIGEDAVSHPVLEASGAFKTKVSSVTDKFSVYATDFLVGQKYFVGGMNRIEQMVGWNIAAASEYNAVVTLPDGRLTEYLPKIDVTENAKSVAALKEFCDGLGCDFLYVQSPYAVCRLENADICGVLDYSNENADDMLALLKKDGVEYLDMRKRLHADGLSHGDAFYRTDHHWKAETGLWAAKSLSLYLNEAHGFAIDTSMLEENQFRTRVYPSWWLGSRGAKLTINRVEAEDFTLFFPKYDTRLRYEIPGNRLDKTGDFTVTYDWKRRATTGGYSENNSYGIYNHGDVAVNILTNLNCPTGKRILIIKDSFTDVVNPFLACADGVGQVDVLDVRHFSGSAKAFIREKAPDIVIVWYNPGALGATDWKSHRATFDFR